MSDDREKLARKFERVGAKDILWTDVIEQCADIAIAYADRRVAEAVAEKVAEISSEELAQDMEDALNAWAEELPEDSFSFAAVQDLLSCDDHEGGIDAMLSAVVRALSPAREGDKS